MLELQAQEAATAAATNALLASMGLSVNKVAPAPSDTFDRRESAESKVSRASYTLDADKPQSMLYVKVWAFADLMSYFFRSATLSFLSCICTFWRVYLFLLPVSAL